jgi:Zn finger protein HypA/HybF involved in hydrogenase expression
MKTPRVTIISLVGIDADREGSPMNELSNMECRACGFNGDDVQDFLSTDEPGARLCPVCGSDECFTRDESDDDLDVRED